VSKRGLGRGIDALLQGKDLEQLDSISPLINVSIDKLMPNPDQPRKTFSEESLKQLADSIKEKGIIQPIIAEDQGNGKFIIIAGERRYRAAQLAGLKEIPVLPKDLSDDEKLEIALIENIQREDLNPIEQAMAIKSLIKTTGHSQDKIAQRLGMGRSSLANILRLLKLPENIQDAIKTNQITSGHGRAILSLNSEEQQQALFERILNDKITVRTAEEQIKPSKSHRNKVQQKSKNIEIKEIEERLIKHLGTKVNVNGNNDSGKIEIRYFSMEDLERVIEVILKD
jgi:ParB family chromosome partitioning protein